MLISEFLELVYYHFIYSLDSYLISVLLVIVIFELFRINKKLNGGYEKNEENETSKRVPDPDNEQ